MQFEKYNPNSLSVSAILGLIASGDIAIPEIQRPFVWKKTQVRDLLDSLYKGYPTGYLIIWKNPNVKLKLNKIAARWPAKAVAQLFTFSKKGSDRIVPR